MTSDLIEENYATIQKPLSLLKHLRIYGLVLPSTELNTRDEEFFIDALGINYRIELRDEEGSGLRVPISELLGACFDLGVYAALHREGSRLTYFRKVTGGTICFVPQA